MTSRRLPLLGAVIAVALVVIAITIVSTRHSSSSSASNRGAEVTQEAIGVATGEPTPTTTVATTPAAAAKEQPAGPYTTPDMPMSVKVTETTGLRSGDVIAVTASPSNGSQAFGVEARLCRGDVAIAFDGQLFPTRAGLCIPTPFAEGTDSFVEVVNKPPFGPISLAFRVGTGSQTFKVQDGSSATVTCDASHPCQLVLKLQYPGGFGFQGVPLTFR